MKGKKINITESEMLAKIVAQGMVDKKGRNVVVMDLRGVAGAPASFFVLCTGNSPLHTQAISDNVHETVKNISKEHPYKLEGYNTGEWVLMDYFDVVAHIMIKETREYYRLEQLWADGKTTVIADDED